MADRDNGCYEIGWEIGYVFGAASDDPEITEEQRGKVVEVGIEHLREKADYDSLLLRQQLRCTRIFTEGQTDGLMAYFAGEDLIPPDYQER